MTVRDIIESWKRGEGLPEKVKQCGVIHENIKVARDKRGLPSGIYCVPVINGQRLARKSFALNTRIELL